MGTIEKKALKKASTKEVFDCILGEFETALDEPAFKEKNAKNFTGKKKNRLI